MTKPKTDSYASVWDAITDTPEEAANLRLRFELMDKVTALIHKNGWTQLEAARHYSVTQPRINDAAARSHFAIFARCAGQHRCAPRPAGAC